MTHQIHAKAVTFDSEGMTLRGNLYLPAAESSGLAAIVVVGTWTSVKEQMADRYAKRLAEKGLAALSFDFRNFGASDGEPRQFESPDLKIQDIHNAVTFLESRPEIDGDKLGILGICASAGYAAANSIADGRVKSLAFVAPWLHNGEIIRAMYGGDEGVAERMARGRAARIKYEATGEIDYVPALSETDPQAAMPMRLDFYLDHDRGGISEWTNRFAVMGWLGWLTFDAVRYGRDMAVPLQIVHSEAAATVDGVKAFYDFVPGKKNITWTEGEQTDFYDQEPQVTRSVDISAEHFDKTLK